MSISLSYTFSPSTRIRSAQVNTNFSTLATRALDKTGDTMTGSLLFTDGLYDIGATGATRPRNLYLSGNVVAGGTTSIGGATLHHTTVTLTNAQIKALPTADYTLIAAPGATTLVIPLLMDCRLVADAGAYTNVNADASMKVEYTCGAPWSNFLANDSQIGLTHFTYVFATAHKAAWQFVPFTVDGLAYDWGNLVQPAGNTLVNNAILLSLDNFGSGALTGGNAANTFSIEIFYATVEVS